MRLGLLWRPPSFVAGYLLAPVLTLALLVIPVLVSWPILGRSTGSPGLVGGLVIVVELDQSRFRDDLHHRYESSVERFISKRFSSTFLQHLLLCLLILYYIRLF